MKQINITLNGKELSTSELLDLVNNPKTQVSISTKALQKCSKANLFLKRILDSRNDIIYGINTGFGPMADYILPKGKLEELQKNLILSHAVGMGNPIDYKFALSAMVVRLNTLAQGYSGVSLELLKKLEQFINLRIIPVIPEHGAVGTSGDLVQLAHIALALLGKGKVFYQGKVFYTKTLLKKLKINPYILKPKEGLSLINGTAMMSGVASILSEKAESILELAIQNSALALELANGYEDSLAKELHSLRPHVGQNKVAEILRQILSSSKLLNNRKLLANGHHNGNAIKKLPKKVQEVYSLRCVAQILGPIFETLELVKKQVTTEINSVTDNPIIDAEKKTYYHGGNFHGDYISWSMDQLKTVLTKLTLLSERRINFFLNPNINQNFPPFLNLQAIGLNLGLQGLQFVATSTASRSQTLSYPQYLHTIPTNGDNQDIVSMGTDSALIASQVVENTYIVLSIELVALCQAVDFLKVENQLSTKSKALYKKVRENFPVVKEDKEIWENLEKLLASLKV